MIWSNFVFSHMLFIPPENDRAAHCWVFCIDYCTLYIVFSAEMSCWKNTSKGNRFAFKNETINYSEKCLGAGFLANNAHKSSLQNKSCSSLWQSFLADTWKSQQEKFLFTFYLWISDYVVNTYNEGSEPCHLQHVVLLHCQLIKVLGKG